MTIAIGALTRFAFVLAADQQEGTGYPGDLKMRIGKISYRSYASAVHDESGHWVASRTICITGCGDTAYLTALRQEIFEEFSKQPNPTLDEFYVKLQSIVRLFWRDHIRPFQNVRNLAHLETTRLLVAVQDRSEQRFWVTNLNKVYPSESGFEAVGSGERWARQSARSIFTYASEKTACVAAAYAVYTAINYAEGCGGDTDIVSIKQPDGFPIVADPDAVRELNRLFQRYENVEHGIRRIIMGSPLSTSREGDIEKSLRELKSEIDKINLFPSWVTPSDPQTSEGPQ